MSITLRPYQAAGIEQLRDHMRAKLRRLVLEIPTGGGKTETAMSMIIDAVAKGSRVLFVVNRTQLLAQTVRRFESAGIECGVMQGQNTRDLHRRVLVISIATLSRRWDELPRDVGLCVIDEAHACGGDTRYHQLIERIHGNSARTAIIGLTATPWAKGMGRHMLALNGPLFQAKISPTTAEELIQAGNLVDADIYAPSEPDLDGVHTVAGDYVERELAERMDRPKLVGDIVETWCKLAHGRHTVVFATSIEHSQHIADDFRKAGVPAEHLDYRAKLEDKEALLARFARKEFTVLCNPLLLREGWDCPGVEVLVMARPTKSLITWVQIAGRVLRPAPGKEKAMILDHSGTALRIGLPTDDRTHYELDDGKPAKSTSERKQKEKPEKLPKKCHVCSYLKAAGQHKCPACGAEPLRPAITQMEDGELSLVTKSRKGEPVVSIFGDKQAVYSGLLHMARSRGYRDGWAAQKYRTIFDVWPRGLHDVTMQPSEALVSWVKSQAIKWAKRKEDAKRISA